ncbi:phage portal protein [Marivita cryptomonadis]|jgi:capsid protein|uniref:phage portal protein n=1 Tax=Marivita cryptomonadis TaxID=505252 RepID=UPI000A1FE872|nr:phage portal protein [Marivita cryptomonadis]
MSVIAKLKDLLSEALPPAAGPEGMNLPRPSGKYLRGGRGVTFAGWKPALREAQDDIGEAWDDAAARVNDLLHNSGWLAGALEQCVANTVGIGLQLKALPENETFGMTPAQASDWAKTVERRFELWARSAQECDIQGLRTFGQMQAAAFRSWLITGEILAELPWRKRPWNRYGTKVRLLPPHRLSRKTESMRRLINGVYTDADGMPVGYRAIRKDLFKHDVEYDVRARDAAGRPRVIHIFEGAPGTHRGISPMEAYIEMVAGYYDGSTLDVGINGRLAHLFPGQELKFHTSNHPSSDYAAFSMHLLRELARCLGLTYESATGDNVGATYSSLQAATTEIFAITKARRRNIMAPFCQPIYEAWLEEEIEAGTLPFPGGMDGFMANRTAACRAEWRGDPRPQADDLKKAKAHEVWKRLGVMSDAMICTDLGADVDDVYQQLAQEQALRAEYGLPEPQMMGAHGGGPAAADETSEEAEA